MADLKIMLVVGTRMYPDMRDGLLTAGGMAARCYECGTHVRIEPDQAANDSTPEGQPPAMMICGNCAMRVASVMVSDPDA